MPTYGYRCPACSAEFEVWQRITDPSGADCPTCGAASTRLFYPAGIVFKGSGFHKTDYRSGSAGGSSGSPKEPTKPADNSSSASSSSAPAAGDKQ